MYATGQEELVIIYRHTLTRTHSISDRQTHRRWDAFDVFGLCMNFGVLKGAAPLIQFNYKHPLCAVVINSWQKCHPFAGEGFMDPGRTMYFLMDLFICDVFSGKQIALPGLLITLQAKITKPSHLWIRWMGWIELLACLSCPLKPLFQTSQASTLETDPKHWWTSAADQTVL